MHAMKIVGKQQSTNHDHHDHRESSHDDDHITNQEGQPHHEPWGSCRTGHTCQLRLADRYGNYHCHHCHRQSTKTL